MFLMTHEEAAAQLQKLFDFNSIMESLPPDTEYERFYDIPGYEGLYKANKLGQIWNCRTESVMQPIKSHHNYKRIALRDASDHVNIYAIHRIIANMFVPNPYNYSEVNHKNEDGGDNRAFNLEWCTRDYNIHYGTRKERMSTEVASYDPKTRVITIYQSQLDASKATGASQGAISNACLGRAHTAAGRYWTIVPKDADPVYGITFDGVDML